MKTQYKFITFILVLIAVTTYIGANFTNQYSKQEEEEEYYYVGEEFFIADDFPDFEIDTWPLFIDAIAWVESKWNPNAIGKRNDIGWLQITPIILKEVERLTGIHYFEKDRFDKEKSIEIFNIIQKYHNPERDLHFALKIWNPQAPISYHRKVMEKYQELLKNYEKQW